MKRSCCKLRVQRAEGLENEEQLVQAEGKEDAEAVASNDPVN
jgi:hypothetical protein